jgi:hypothetical protein
MELNSQDAPIMTLNYNLIEDLFSKLSTVGKASPKSMESLPADVDSCKSLGYQSLQSKEQLVNFVQQKLIYFFLNVLLSISYKSQCLDAKRTMSINIYLKQIKSPLNDFIQLIIDGKYKTIGFDNLNCLKKILPDKTEVKTLFELEI